MLARELVMSIIPIFFPWEVNLILLKSKSQKALMILHNNFQQMHKFA